MEEARRRSRTRNQYRRKLREQRLMGIAVLIAAFVFLYLTWTANEDCGAFLIMAPFGFALLFSRKILIV